MALVLNRKYTGEGSTIRFYAARYTRLWLPYIPIIILTIALLAYTDALKSVSFAYSQAPLWLAALAVLANITIIGQDLFWLIGYSADSVSYIPYGESGSNGHSLMLNSPLFTVSIEFYFYLLAPYFTKNTNRCFLLLLSGSLWLLLSSYFGYSHNLGLQYQAAPSVLMYFGLGAIVYHLSQNSLSYRHYFLLCLCALLVVTSSTIIRGWLPLFMAFSIIFLFRATQENALDSYIGEYSYLLYITHKPLMQFAMYQFGLNRGFELFIYTASLALITSFVLYYSVDRYVASYRARKYGSGHITWSRPESNLCYLFSRHQMHLTVI